MTVKRSYVSSHIYKTPSGQFWDDRTSKRITNRRGASIERNVPKQRERMAVRIRDEHGRLSFRRVKAISDIRSKKAKGAHTGSPGEMEFEEVTIYKPESSFAHDYVENRANAADEEYSHFNVHDIEYTEV